MGDPALEYAKEIVEHARPDLIEDESRTENLKGLTGIDGARLVVPDQTYRPKVRVFFDFVRPVLRAAQINVTKIKVKGRKKKKAISLEDLVRMEEGRDFGMVRRWLDGLSMLGDIFAGFPGEMPGIDDVNLGTKGEISDEQMVMDINRLLNLFLESVSVSQVKKGVGSASMTFRFNTLRHGEKARAVRESLIFDYDIELMLNQLFAPHVHVYVLMKGRLRPDYYFHVFHGLTTNISFKTEGGLESLEVECADYKKLLHISEFLWNPAILADLKTPEDFTPFRVYGELFYRARAEKIISSLIVGTGRGKGSANKGRDPKFEVGYTIVGVADFERAADDRTIIAAHNGRYQKIEAVDKLRSINTIRGTPSLIIWGADVSPYRIFSTQSIPIGRSELRNRLELCEDVATRMFFEFYCDGAGNFCFHPMRLNHSFLTGFFAWPDEEALRKQLKKKEISKIFKMVAAQILSEPEPLRDGNIVDEGEIISEDITYSDEEVVTLLHFFGEHSYVKGEVVQRTKLAAQVRNEFLETRFGMRRKEIVNPNVNVGSGRQLSMFARAYMDLVNAEVFNGSVSTILRPEMEIAKPILLVEREEIYYVNSITHHVTIHGEARTDIGLSFGRKVTDKSAMDFVDHLIQRSQFKQRSDEDNEVLFTKFLVRKSKEEKDAVKAREDIGVRRKR